MDSLYTRAFFDALADDSAKSAEVVVPLAVDLVKPASVVDVGCGTGAWLAAFHSAGVQRVLGIDGDYIAREALHIPNESFISMDLAQPRDFSISETFDLAVSLEVAEHLPPSAAPQFVRSLTRLAPVVLFSAAVPGQTGTGHINERWPTYWAALFFQHGYAQLDPFRTRLWRDTRVAWWYRQNLFLYVHGTRAPVELRTRLAQEEAGDPDLLLVHRTVIESLEAAISRQQVRIATLSTGRGALKNFLECVWRWTRRRFGLRGQR
jgi:SAM-dependent methyltransferase